MKVISKIGSIIFKKKMESIESKLKYANININAPFFTGLNLLLVIISSVFVFQLTLFYLGIYYAIGAFSFFIFLYYVVLSSIISLMADKRARFVESILPDVLRLISSNLKSGIDIDEALVLSARPEFEFFSEKIKDIGKLLATGKSLEKAILNLPKDIDSEILKKTIQIIIEGLQSGGELSVLLESIADNIEETEVLRKEVNSTIFVYALFIFIASCLIAPVLYAVSIQLAGVLSRLSESIAMQFMAEEATTPVTLASVTLSENFLRNFAYVNLIITTAFASLIIALINRGNEKYGIKYIPFLISIALILFYVSTLILRSFFGGIRVI